MELPTIYRGQRKLNGDWVFGSYIYVGDDWCQIVPIGTEYDDLKSEMMRVITRTVSPAVGILDKNDKGYFLNDIVKFADGSTGVLIWFGDCLGIGSGPIDDYTAIDQVRGYELRKAEIIGNIIDNPKLINY